MFEFKAHKSSWILAALIIALTAPFQNCGKLENSPGNGQGYEGVKLPSGGTYDTGSGSAPGETSPAPAVSGIKLDSTVSETWHTPRASWAATSYSHFMHYEVAVFHHPSMMMVKPWGPIAQPEAQIFGLLLLDGQQYTLGVRIVGPLGPGPITHSPVWLAYSPYVQ